MGMAIEEAINVGYSQNVTNLLRLCLKENNRPTALEIIKSSKALCEEVVHLTTNIIEEYKEH